MIDVRSVVNRIEICFDRGDHVGRIHGSETISRPNAASEGTDLAEESFLRLANKLDRLPLDDRDLDRPRGDFDGDLSLEGETDRDHGSASTAGGADLRRRDQLNMTKGYNDS